MGDQAEFGNLDIVPYLSKIEPVRAVLVGGQAVSFWAHQFRDKLPPEMRTAPLTSGDMDFAVPGLREAERSAALLQGEMLQPDFDDPTPSIALVWAKDGRGRRLRIDFLAVVYGVPNNLYDKALDAEVLDESHKPTGVKFRVMHPLHALRSRIANTMGLPGYDTPHALGQLRAATYCLRAFIESILVRAQEQSVESRPFLRAVLRLNEETFRLARETNSVGVYWKYGIDTFENAIVAHDLLPERFRQVRLPQMREAMERERRRHRPKHLSASK